MATKGHGATRYVGTNAERVALATNDLVAGVLFIETDTLVIYTWDGSAWQTNGGGGPFLRLNASNDPVTAGLEINANTADEPVLILQTVDDDATNPIQEWQDSADNVLTSVTSEGDPTIGKASGRGIKVDTTTPTFGWRDLLGDTFVRNTGGTKPTHAIYRDTLREFQFAAGKEGYFTYHIPHDYVEGTDIFIHIHWSHIGTLVTGGTVTFEYEASYSKGHNQAPFPASVSGTLVGTASATQYQHILTEIQLSASAPSGSQIDTDDLEPDGVIIMRAGVQANNITVSSGGVPDPFLHYVDIHYQSTGISTKEKAPDFYA